MISACYHLSWTRIVYSQVIQICPGHVMDIGQSHHTHNVSVISPAPLCPYHDCHSFMSPGQSRHLETVKG